MALQDGEHTIALNNEVLMPEIGFGVWRAEEGPETVNAVKAALANSYRLIDTAAFYKNEKSVGEAIASSDVPRDQIFVTTKVWNDDIRAGKTKEAFDKSLKLLGLDYLDLYMMDKINSCYVAFTRAVSELYIFTSMPGRSDSSAGYFLN